MSKTAPESLPVNGRGLVPIKFLGLLDDRGERCGEAGLGLRVGEIRGVLPVVAANMIDRGTAEVVKAEVVKAEVVKAPPKPASK